MKRTKVNLIAIAVYAAKLCAEEEGSFNDDSNVHDILLLSNSYIKLQG